MSTKTKPIPKHSAKTLPPELWNKVIIDYCGDSTHKTLAALSGTCHDLRSVFYPRPDEDNYEGTISPTSNTNSLALSRIPRVPVHDMEELWHGLWKRRFCTLNILTFKNLNPKHMILALYDLVILFI